MHVSENGVVGMEGNRKEIAWAGGDLYTVIIDLEKAYDRISQKTMWEVWCSKGVTDSYITLIKNMYKGSRDESKK